MELPKNEQKYLVDSAGDFLAIDIVRGHYKKLLMAGYNALDFNYNKKVFISKENLDKFDPVEETGKLFFNQEKIFGILYAYWYNIDLDIYIVLSSTVINKYYQEEDVEVDSNFIKISNIFYKHENIQDVQRFLNETLTSNVPTENKIDIIIQNQSGFEFVEHSIKPLSLDIDRMYNDDFRPVYNHIVDKLNNSGKGIVLLHGEKGAGKTSLVRNLTTVVNKKFVFVPINMIGHISSPSFIGDLIENKGGVLVIEDCEQYIQDRGTSSNTIVSSLLQITDGMLGDVMDMQVICTFNTDLTKVDDALRREGRLIAEYEFGKLSAEKTHELSNGKYNEPKTLAEIYNTLTYRENKKEHKKIGFGR